MVKMPLHLECYSLLVSFWKFFSLFCFDTTQKGKHSTFVSRSVLKWCLKFICHKYHTSMSSDISGAILLQCCRLPFLKAGWFDWICSRVAYFLDLTGLKVGDEHSSGGAKCNILSSAPFPVARRLCQWQGWQSNELNYVKYIWYGSFLLHTLEV